MKLTLSTQLAHIIEPTCVTIALKDDKWRLALSTEFDALVNNGTWILVPPGPHQNVVGCKWIFCIKPLVDGSIDRYKARLVAKGFHQRRGIDYTETFSPLIKPITVRLILSLAIGHDWTLRQLDVNNAFLQSTLTDDVYMAQPRGFVDPDKPNHVCKLKKAIYGLKQAPRAWYNELRQFLLDSHFTNSVADTYLFIYIENGVTILVLVYVDDIIVTGNQTPAVNDFISVLARRFSVKDLGALHYFLVLFIIFWVSRSFHNQQVSFYPSDDALLISWLGPT